MNGIPSHSFLWLFFLLFFFFLWLFFLLFFFCLWLFSSLFTLTTFIVGINGLSNFHGGVLQSLDGFLNVSWIFGSKSFVQSGDITVDLIFNILWDSSAMLSQLLFGVINSLISFVFHVNHFSSSLILLLRGLGILDHLLNLSVTKTTT